MDIRIIRDEVVSGFLEPYLRESLLLLLNDRSTATDFDALSAKYLTKFEEGLLSRGVPADIVASELLQLRERLESHKNFYTTARR